MKIHLSNHIIGLLALALVSGCSDHSGGHGPQKLETIEVKTAMSVEKKHQRFQRLPGTVHPSEQAIVAAKIMATVDSIDLAIGQEVSQGDILARLKADEVDARVEQAEASLAQIERNLSRETALLKQNATTAETVRTLEDQKRLATAQLAEARTMQEYKLIRAPFDGIIVSKNVRRGDLASPGIPLLTIEGMGNREIHVQVPDSLSALPHGSDITVIADGREINAVLNEWSPAADTQSRSRLAKLLVKDDVRVRSGQYVGVNWPAGETRSVWVPAKAVSTIGQMDRVFTVDNNVARLHLVRTGSVNDGFIQIISGLQGDLIIVLEASNILVDGQPVVIKK